MDEKRKCTYFTTDENWPPSARWASLCFGSSPLFSHSCQLVGPVDGDWPPLGAEFPNGMDHEVQPDSSTAKLCVKNPGGAIRRKDRTGISSVGPLRLVGVSGSIAALPSPSLV